MQKEENTNPEAISLVQKKRRGLPNANDLIRDISLGKPSALTRAITLIESSEAKHREVGQQILKANFHKTFNTLRIGISGIPGAGKSTFIEALGNHLLNSGRRVAVLAIDPTSPTSGGSILGDKTRMPSLAANENAFIRPSPTRATLGGVNQGTQEAILLCEAAGYEYIFVETVGTGQNETAVHGMVDFFIVLQLAGAGDSLQAIKRGILELADLIVINKAEYEKRVQIQETIQHFSEALTLYPLKKNGWTRRLLPCSALNDEGFDEVMQIISDYRQQQQASGHLEQNRKQQRKNWFTKALEDQLLSNFYCSKKNEKMLAEVLPKIIEGGITIYEAIQLLLNPSSAIK